MATSAGRTRWRWAAGFVGLGVITGLIFLFVPNLSHPGPALPASWRSSTAGTSVSAAANRGPIALWVGDNDSTGAGASAPNRAFPQVASAMLGWSLVLDAQDGTGFVAKGRNVSAGNAPYQSRWAQHVGTVQPGFVVISGGRNDAPRSSGAAGASASTSAGSGTSTGPGAGAAPGTAAAVKRYLKTVRTTFPNAKIIVIAPAVRVDQAVNPTVEAIRAAERSQATRLHLIVVDPIGEGWLDATNAHVYFAEGGLKLNDAGQAYLADRLVGALAAQGIHP